MSSAAKHMEKHIMIDIYWTQGQSDTVGFIWWFQSGSRDRNRFVRNVQHEQLTCFISTLLLTPFSKKKRGECEKSPRNKSNECTWKCVCIVIHYANSEELRTTENDDWRLQTRIKIATWKRHKETEKWNEAMWCLSIIEQEPYNIHWYESKIIYILYKKLCYTSYNLYIILVSTVCLFGFYGISTIAGYLMPNLFLYNKQFHFEQFNFA